MARTRTTGWTRETEQAAVSRLLRDHPVILVYTRQSKSDEDDAGHVVGVSLEQQRVAWQRRPELAGCRAEYFQDADRSGRETSKRDGYIAMMKRMRTAADGTIGAIFCYDQDRLHRNVVEFYRFMEECEERGVLVFDAGGLVRNEDELAWGIKAVVAAVERKKIARRIRDNLQHLKQQGRVLGHAPLGYGVVGKNAARRLEVDAEAGPIVRRIFELYASGGLSIERLARQLNDEATPLPKNPDYPKAAHRWSANLLKGLLANPTYIGKVRLGTELHDGGHPALIDDETFATVQAVRVGNRVRKTEYRHRVHPYALTGLLVCERCFGRLQGHQRMVPLKDGSKHMLTYYRCGNKYTERRCDAPWIRAEILEQALRENLAYCVGLGMAGTDRVAQLSAGLAKAPNPRKTLETTLKRLDEKERRLRWLFMERQELTQSEYVEKQNEINLERQAARKAATTAPAEEFAWAAAQIGNLVGVWDSASPATKGQMLRKMFTRIEVNTVEAEAATPALVGVQCVPQPAWWNFFHRVVVNLQSGEPYVLKLPYMADVGPGSYFAKVAGGETLAQRTSRGQLSPAGGEVSAQRESRG